MKLKEKPFVQNFDIIAKKERLTLDIEKDKYPEDKVTFYLNGSTGKMGNTLESVIREGVVYKEQKADNLKDKERFISSEYDEEQEIVFVHMLYRIPLSRFTEGARFGYKEFSRFALGRDLHVYTKENGYSYTGRAKYYSCNASYYEQCLKNDGLYKEGYGKTCLPFNKISFEGIFNGHINIHNGEMGGFVNKLCNIYPAVFNVTGNNYLLLSSYDNLYEYFSIAENETCLKKSGKKQEYIDKMVAIKLPDVEFPAAEFNNCNNWDEYKFAVIQHVNTEEPTCCVRTFTYFKPDNILFEGGRIYITKKSAEFCKKNNLGEYVAQPLLQKANHWDFAIMKFGEEETKGTMLEYFGSVVQTIEPDNRAIAIWMFIKDPFFESLAKISSSDFTNALINLLRETDDLSPLLHTLGISKKSKKVLQALGISKQQFDVINEYMEFGLPKVIYDPYYNLEYLTLGMLPFIKHMMCGNSSGDISNYDVETFKKYLDFAIDVYSLYDIWKEETIKHVWINKMIKNVLELRDMVITTFPTFNICHDFDVFKQLVNKAAEYGYSRNSWEEGIPESRAFKDYMIMLMQIPTHQLYQPRFSSLEDIITMHDNIQTLVEIHHDEFTDNRFKSRYHVWQEWEFQQDENKENGATNKDELPFIVVAPKTSDDLANEGTRLHHCVRSYIERVARGETNIMFIRKKEEPCEPFFTVEISNEGVIEQVHGFGNRNADTEPGMVAFIQKWVKKKSLKTHSMNKVR